MARIDLHLPDELTETALAAGLNVSAIAQFAIRQTLADRSIAAVDSTRNSRRADNPALLAALPDLGVDAPRVLDDLDVARDTR